MVAAAAPSYRRAMTMTEPTLEPDAPDEPPVAPPEARHAVWRSDQRVVSGTAAGLADGWGVDPAWVRLAFTVLALRGGLGACLYAAAWALLPASPSAPRTPLANRLVGAAAGGLALLTLGSGWIGAPWSVIVVLAGAAAALWRGSTPRVARTVRPTWAPPSAPEPAAAPQTDPRPPRHRRAHVPRPPSVVGRLGLALALAVVAVTALVTDGRPGAMAVAFGAAAAICGAGLVVASFGRRARYLALPAVLALAASTVAASVDGLGVRVGLSGDWRSYGASALPARIDHRAGSIQVDLTDADRSASTVVRVGTGDVDIVLDPDRPVRVDLRARVGLGSIDVIGQRSASGYRPAVTTSVGPSDGPTVVTVDVAVGIGSVEVLYVSRPETPPEPTTFPTVPPADPQLPNGAVAVEPDGIEVYEGGARRFPDGSLALPDGTQVEADNTRRYGPGVVVEPGGEAVLPDGTRVLVSGTVVLPSGVVVSPTPDGERG